MNTPSSFPPHAGADDFDAGPLSWVIGEIADALAHSRAALTEALTQDADLRSTALRQARTWLHQVHGALQIVDVDGVVILTETVEDLLERFESGQVELTPEAADTIALACRALVEYLEELLAGLPHQPVRLFPYYRALLEVRGAERIHPADLFFPNLTARPQLPPASHALTRDDYVVLRKRFERALLLYLKGGGGRSGQAGAIAMRDLLQKVEAAQTSPQTRAFWWVMAGFADAVADDQIGGELYVRQLFARINLQLRRLAEGSASIAERLLRDALFFLARIDAPSPQASLIRSTYRLDGAVPADYEARRYGQVDAQSLTDARARLSQAKILWNRIAGGDTGVASAFQQEMAGLAEAGDGLNAPALGKLLRELSGIARHAAHTVPGDAVSLEIATSLLFVEQALQQIGHLPDDFAERAEAVTARLLSAVAGEPLAPSAQWLDEMSRQAQQRQSMTVLASELQSSLRQVEKQLDAYFRDPQQKAGLSEVEGILYQIHGALAILDHEEAMRAVRHVQETVRGFVATEEVADAALLEQVAQNVGALSFFIETLPLHGEGSHRFSFDDESGTFRANLIDDRRRHAEADGADMTDDGQTAAALPETAMDSEEQVLAAPTVEDELAAHQRQSQQLAHSLAAEPDNLQLQEQLKESLEQVRLDARLVDNPDAGDRARAVIDMLESPDFIASSAALDEIALAEPEQPATDAIASPATPETEAEADAELLDIFLGEAVEVLACIAETLPLSRNAPHNQEYLTTLRRSFHTLKGSSRMVGLVAFGEAAWSIEQVLNLRLADTQGGDPELHALIDCAAQQLGAWVSELRQTGGSQRDGRALIDAAERVRHGQPFSLESTPETVEAEELQLSDEELVQFGRFTSATEEMAAEQHDAAQESPAQDMESAAENVVDFPGNPVGGPAADDHIKRIGDLEIGMPLYSIYLTETDELVRRLAHDFSEWRHEPDRHVSVQAVHAAHSLAGSSATVGFLSLHQLAYALEMVLQYLARKPVKLLWSEYDVLDQSVECIRAMLLKFALGEMPEDEAEQVAQLTAMPEDFEGRSLEPIVAGTAASASFLSDDDGVSEVPDLPASHLAAAAHGQDAIETSDAALFMQDEIDADLLPVFIEEGRDMLPQIGEALRGWQLQPDDAVMPQTLLRLLHTVKGSARMAGAMALGQHLHEMETRIETISHAGHPAAPMFDDLLARHDLASQLFEQLQDGDTSASSGAESASEQAASESAGEVTAPVQDATTGGSDVVQERRLQTAEAPRAVTTQAAAPLVRVRADILDRVVNQAGEVSISRSRLENEVGTLRQSLGELSDNVSRLRDQLREIEMQAESQITSSMGSSPEREFDPLEFDRFTRLQELTRMMAESVSDVGTVQQTLNRTIESASAGLSVQARLTRDLQQDLMRVRMVKFASIADRLYRVTRQAAKEMDKRVNLDIRGAAVELDRSVLEKMTGPFEHLLRNAIVHGIESRERRRAAGKSETGELRIEVRQEGNEVVIQFSDDGRGLDIDGIRNKATAIGLLGSDAQLSDAETSELIFHPGFSTAEEVTELAGRGIGMDVVRSEAVSLGGRIAIVSEPGAGAQFTIHLPLTLAVTQVVLLSTGGRIYAVPSVLVEQVQQLKVGPLSLAYNEGALLWQSQRVPLHYLSALLGDAEATPVTQQYSPLLILKSGSDRVAIHVDEVIGNREVVVKNIGPQLSRMIGIAGATVLGSGEIVLILNPVPLAQRAAQENIRAPRLTPSDAPDNMGAVVELTSDDHAGQPAAPVQGLRAQPIVMVVDDSLTVRRVTQRLLTREGYQVVLAKDGVDALEHLQSVTPDVMLVDIEMPRMDGFDLTRNIRDDERTRGIPIIMITSRTAAKHRNFAMELGVNEYLGKPYQEDVLLELIAGFVGRYSALH
ncbi:hybrid sensor histidine kinase/response regulator [Oxalicibacterium flavum]|nr:Hpt domain-containing protein [Oxalicibacterium flavum]